MFVVAGGSGQTGSVVADTLLRKGERVRLIARTPAKVRALVERGAEVVQADLNDTQSLRVALQGARGCYLLVPPAMAARDLLATHRTLIAAMTAAVEQARPQHVVCLSAAGAHLVPSVGPVESLRWAEQALRATSANVTFVRPPFFMESLITSFDALLAGVLPTFLRADRPTRMVGTQDVGAISAQALLDGPRGQRVIEVDGPRQYTPIEVAAEISRLVNRPIRVQEIPEADIVATIEGAGMSRQVAELSLAMFHAINTGALPFEFDESMRVHGTTPVHEVLAKLLAKPR